MNELLKFYEQHKISPVSQDISDLYLHFSRRTGLYRTLGLPPLLFKGRDILEVAPGSGFNSIVTASFGARSYDLVEPNTTGFNKMVSVFEKSNIGNTAVQFFNCRLDEYREQRSYDVILCEGLIQGLENQEQFVLSLAKFLRPGGILVLTCSDAISLFFETLRQYISRILVAQARSATPSAIDFVQITEMLTEVFSSHLGSLKGRSRPTSDWVQDVLLNPTGTSESLQNEFSFAKCMEIFGGEFWLYGMSPNFLTNFGWYKELSPEPKIYNQAYLESFYNQWQCLLHYREVGRSEAKHNFLLHDLCRQFAETVAGKAPLNPPELSHQAILQELEPVRQILALTENCDMDLSRAALVQFLNLFAKGMPTPSDIAQAGAFGAAFGRGQQYISLVKPE
ncbi:MAG: class I SAM-dependent methyltransferase [Sulfuricellaceae bacterium]